MVPAADIPNAVVLYSLIVNVSRIFGPALAGLLVVTLGYGWCFTIDAATYLAVLFCLYIMRPEELHRLPRQATRHRWRARGPALREVHAAAVDSASSCWPLSGWWPTTSMSPFRSS